MPAGRGRIAMSKDPTIRCRASAPTPAEIIEQVPQFYHRQGHNTCQIQRYEFLTCGVVPVNLVRWANSRRRVRDSLRRCGFLNFEAEGDG